MAKSEKIKLIRGEDIKYIAPRHLEACIALGWEQEDSKNTTKATTDTGNSGYAGDFDRETTIALLKEAGKNVHPNTGDEKLKAMLEELSA